MTLACFAPGSLCSRSASGTRNAGPALQGLAKILGAKVHSFILWLTSSSFCAAPAKEPLLDRRRAGLPRFFKAAAHRGAVDKSGNAWGAHFAQCSVRGRESCCKRRAAGSLLGSLFPPRACFTASLGTACSVAALSCLPLATLLLLLHAEGKQLFSTGPRKGSPKIAANKAAA